MKRHQDKVSKISDDPKPPRNLDFCPRCGLQIDEIIWGKTNCPGCGLHFECC